MKIWKKYNEIKNECTTSFRSSKIYNALKVNEKLLVVLEYLLVRKRFDSYDFAIKFFNSNNYTVIKEINYTDHFKLKPRLGQIFMVFYMIIFV
jgi:hypothetical protein